jgi:hypothetical protein
VSDRWMFLAAFHSLVLVVVSAFAFPALFMDELLSRPSSSWSRSREAYFCFPTLARCK